MSIGRKFLKKQSEIYKNPLNPMRFLRGQRVEDLKVANKAALVQRGKDPSVLIVAFTGSAKMLMMPVYEFFDLTKSLGYSRIPLRDRFNKRYHRGIDRQRPDYPSFLDFLHREIKKLGAKKTIFVGTSAGGYAAIRVGHDLSADYVHAFGAQTGLIRSTSDCPTVSRPWICRRFSMNQTPIPHTICIIAIATSLIACTRKESPAVPTWLRWAILVRPT